MCHDQRTEVFILDCSFELMMSWCSKSVEMGIVLQVAFSSLITDGTVQRMVDENELQDTTPSQSCCFWMSINTHSGCNLRTARRNRFGWLCHLNEAHTTIACNFESLMIAESRNLDTVLLTCLKDGQLWFNLHPRRSVPGRPCHWWTSQSSLRESDWTSYLWAPNPWGSFSQLVISLYL